MKRQVIIYKAKPEVADENQRILENVFAELQTAQPAEFRYLLLRMKDDTFVHLVFSDTDGPLPITQLDTFKTYVAGVRDRLTAPPQQGEATIVGDYRMLSE
jgi:hypothetical protein